EPPLHAMRVVARGPNLKPASSSSKCPRNWLQTALPVASEVFGSSRITACAPSCPTGTPSMLARSQSTPAGVVEAAEGCPVVVEGFSPKLESGGAFTAPGCSPVGGVDFALHAANSSAATAHDSTKRLRIITMRLPRVAGRE